MIHGLALKIRSSTESETFDLGGLSAETIQTVVRDSFREPFESLPDNQMIRITLIIGAGKQARQKYDASALRVVTVELQSLGFAEDKGASCTIECQGLYKYQHDTGKNLKTVVVFPNFQQQQQKTIDASKPGTRTSSSSLSTMEKKIAQSTLKVFQTMVSSKCPTWSQKKSLLQFLDDTIVNPIKECEQLLISGQLLSETQQILYDSALEVEDKRQFLSKELHAHVDREGLTRSELDYLKAQNEQKISSSKVPPDRKLLDRREKLASITPKDLATLQHHVALGKLWKQLKAFQHIDEHCNHLRSLNETQLLGQKMDLLEQIEQLEQASRGWFEDDDIFEARRLACRSYYQKQVGMTTGGGGVRPKKSTPQQQPQQVLSMHAKQQRGMTTFDSPPVRGPTAATQWVTPTSTKVLPVVAKKKTCLEKRDVFGAMRVTRDDSESDDDDDDVDGQNEDIHEAVQTVNPTNKVDVLTNNIPATRTTAATTATTMELSDANTLTQNSKKKSKKKKKSDGGGPGDSSSKSVPKATEAEFSSFVATLQTIFQGFLLPVLLAIVTWLVRLAFGKPKATKNKKA